MRDRDRVPEALANPARLKARADEGRRVRQRLRVGAGSMFACGAEHPWGVARCELQRDHEPQHEADGGAVRW